MLSMLDGSNVQGQQVKLPGIGLAVENICAGMKEQAASTIANLAQNSADMQDAIIDADAVPSLLAVIQTGSRLGQEHAALEGIGVSHEVAKKKFSHTLG